MVRKELVSGLSAVARVGEDGFQNRGCGVVAEAERGTACWVLGGVVREEAGDKTGRQSAQWAKGVDEKVVEGAGARGSSWGWAGAGACACACDQL
jgi:hypothetical protein